MEKYLLPIVVAFVTAVSSTSITLFSDEIRTYINPSKENIVGIWDCEWLVTSPNHKGKAKVTDTLTITNKIDGRIIGHGYEADAGKYNINGEDTPYATTFIYHGFGPTHTNARGTVILRKGYNLNVLEGEWNQLTDSSSIVGGTVRCSRKNPNNAN
jgi:hypothetical protein